MAVIDELLVSLGFDYDPEDLEQFQEDLEGTTELVKKLATAFVAGTAALIGFAATTSAASDEQGKLAEEIGVSVEMLDALQFANRRSGGSAEGLSSSLQQLAVRIGETARGVGSGIEAFGILGVEVTNTNGELKDTSQVLLEVSDKFQTLSKSQQIELAEKLGLRDSIRLLQQGSGGISDLIKEANALGVTTKEDAAISAEFQDSLTDIWQIVKQLSRTLSQVLLPIMENISNVFTEWWKANRQVIEQNIPKFVEQATKALKLLAVAAGAFVSVKIVSTLISMVSLMKGVTLGALAMNAAIAAIPLLISSLVVGLALLAEDAKKFFEGGESFIGDMIEKFPEWANEIKTVAAVLATVADIVTSIFEGWKLIFELFKTDISGDLKLVFEQLNKDFDNMLNGITSSIRGVFSDLTDQVLGTFKEVTDKVTDIFSFGDSDAKVSATLNPIDDSDTVISATLNPIGDLDAVISATLNPIVKGIASGVPASQLGQNSSFSSSDIRNTTNSGTTNKFEGGIQIQIDGAGSPEQTGEAVRREIANLTKQTSIDLNSAVAL